MDIVIRRERETDYRIVEEVTREAFWNLYVPGCDEHYVSHVLRKHPDFIEEMDFVAEKDGRVVGSIMYSRSFVVAGDGTRLDTLTFGPLCVLPDYQYQGIGTALIGHTKELAIQRGFPAIIIFGAPKNYCRHGFKSSKDFMISDANGRYPYGMLVLELEVGAFTGRTWRYHGSEAYDIDRKDVEEFDRRFPSKKKEAAPSQVEFSIAIRAFLD